MRKMTSFAGALASALGLGWGALASAQSLPSPAAPARIAPQGQVQAQPQRDSTGVINADAVFNPGVRPQVNQTQYQQQCQQYNAAPASEPDCFLWNPGGEPFFNLNDARWGDTPECEQCFKVGGWLQNGFHDKNNPLGFNNHRDEFNMHQAYLYAEKVADGSQGGGFGFRADVVYGVDAQDTQSFGNNFGRFDFSEDFQHGKYGWAIPQLYGEVAVEDVSVKVGHFYTIIGYEVVTAPDNFFYSHAFTMYNSEPFTHTGALATWQATEDITVWTGYVLGWDTGFDRFDDGSSFLGGVSLALTDDVTFTYATVVGDFGSRGEGYMHSVVISAQLLDDLEYVIQHDLMDSNGGDYQVGVNQYLFYTINDWLAVGTRQEWWRARFPGTGVADPVSVYGSTFGANIKPNGNLTIRPEIKYQWSPGINGAGPAGPTGLYDDFGEWIFGVDAVWVF